MVSIGRGFFFLVSGLSRLSHLVLSFATEDDDECRIWYHDAVGQDSKIKRGKPLSRQWNQIQFKPRLHYRYMLD